MNEAMGVACIIILFLLFAAMVSPNKNRGSGGYVTLETSEPPPPPRSVVVGKVPPEPHRPKVKTFYGAESIPEKCFVEEKPKIGGCEMAKQVRNCDCGRQRPEDAAYIRGGFIAADSYECLKNERDVLLDAVVSVVDFLELHARDNNFLIGKAKRAIALCHHKKVPTK